MSNCIRWGDDSGTTGGMIWFDAVTAQSVNLKGQVTKHPLDSGVSISDHFIRQNTTISMSVVITSVDISTNTYLIQDLAGNSPYNVQQAPTAVSVNSTDASVLTKFLPDSVGQFLPDTTPEVVVDSARDDVLEKVKSFLARLMNGTSFNEKTGYFDPEIQIVKLYEYEGTLIRRVVNNLVVTSLTFKESPETGHGLYADISLEEVHFVELKKTKIPSNIVSALKPKASEKASKGNQDSLPDSGDAPKDVDPLREARANG